MPTAGSNAVRHQAGLAERDRIAQVVVVVLGEHAALHERLQLPVDPRSRTATGRGSRARRPSRRWRRRPPSTSCLPRPNRLPCTNSRPNALLLADHEPVGTGAHGNLSLTEMLMRTPEPVRLPPDVHVGEQAGRVQPLAHRVQRVGLHRVADGDAGDGANGRLLRAHVAHHADVGDLLADRERRACKPRQRQTDDGGHSRGPQGERESTTCLKHIGTDEVRKCPSLNDRHGRRRTRPRRRKP